MAKLLLHAGLPKTGTSFVQSFVNVNYQILGDFAGLGFLTGRATHELACHLISDEALWQRADIVNLRAGSIDTIFNTLMCVALDGKDCFCSSEYFDLSDRDRTFNYFSQFFDEIEIIYAVRRQDHLLASGYNQEVKAMGRATDLQWSYASAKQLNYYETCKSWQRAGFTVRVIDYDAVKQEENGLLKALFGPLMDFDKVMDAGAVLPAEEAANYSLSEAGVMLKLLVNRENGSYAGVADQFTSIERNRYPFKLPKRYGDILASAYLSGNQKLLDEFVDKSNLSELLFPDNQIDTQLNAAEATFCWDPLERVGGLLSFLLKNSSAK